jgi:hypothetical protein
MNLKTTSITVLISLGLAGGAAAQDSGSFIVRLGQDTTGVEQFTQTAAGVEVLQVGRSPRVLRRRYFYGMDARGNMKTMSITASNPLEPAGAPPLQQIDATFSSDSMRMEIRGPQGSRSVHVAMSPQTVMLSGTSPWEIYELLSMRLAAQKADSLRWTAYYLGGDGLTWVVLRRAGRGAIVIQNQYDGYRAQIDATGHILHLDPIHGTAQYTVDRVKKLDLAAYTSDFAAAEKQAGAMGALSTRDTVRVSAGGANLWIDYGRPAMRGREIFGSLVPWGVVWRTGANAATQFKTDRALNMNGTVVPAGFYSLWSIPTETGTRLVINSETGQWGTDHKPEKDVYTIDMQVSVLPQPVERFTISVEPGDRGGTLHMDWATRRASLAFTTEAAGN